MTTLERRQEIAIQLLQHNNDLLITNLVTAQEKIVELEAEVTKLKPVPTKPKKP